MTRSCKTCQMVGIDPSRGHCHGAPPTASEKDGTAIWPVTHKSDHSGAFRIAEALAGGRDKRARQSQETAA